MAKKPIAQRPDEPLDIAVLLDSPELFRLCAIWPRLDKSQRQDQNIIADAANISRSQIERFLTCAKVSNLIRDDGTINEYARRYLATVTHAKLQKVTPRSGSKKNPPAAEE